MARLLKKKHKSVTVRGGWGTIVPLHRREDGTWAPLQKAREQKERGRGAGGGRPGPPMYLRRMVPRTTTIESRGTIGRFIKSLNGPNSGLPSYEALTKFLEKASPLHIRLLTRAGVEKVDAAVRGNPKLMELWEKKKREA